MTHYSPQCLFVAASVSLLCTTVPNAEAAPHAFKTEVEADSPLAYWRLGELPPTSTAADATGNGFDGTYSASGLTLGQPGVLGGDTAVQFDGTGPGSVTVPHSAGLNVTQVTMESVIRWDGGNGTQQRIIEKSTEPGSTRPVFSLQVFDNSHVRVELGFLDIENEVIELDSLGTITVGAPTHLAATFDGSEIKLYINGLLDNSGAFSGSIRTDTDRPLGIGNQAERERPFNGLIDEVVLYGYALSPERVAAHWQAVPEPSTALLLALAVPLFALTALRKRNSKLSLSSYGE